jgi:hypothetical protein
MVRTRSLNYRHKSWRSAGHRTFVREVLGSNAAWRFSWCTNTLLDKYRNSTSNRPRQLLCTLLFGCSQSGIVSGSLNLTFKSWMRILMSNEYRKPGWEDGCWKKICRVTRCSAWKSLLFNVIKVIPRLKDVYDMLKNCTKWIQIMQIIRSFILKFLKRLRLNSLTHSIVIALLIVVKLTRDFMEIRLFVLILFIHSFINGSTALCWTLASSAVS